MTSRLRRTVKTSPRTEQFSEEEHSILAHIVFLFKIVHFSLNFTPCMCFYSIMSKKPKFELFVKETVPHGTPYVLHGTVGVLYGTLLKI